MKLASGLVLFAVFLFNCVPGDAQSINSGTITGTVIDQSGAVIRGVNVVLQNHITGYQRTAVTDENGSFRFNSIPRAQEPLSIGTGRGVYRRDSDIDDLRSPPKAGPRFVGRRQGRDEHRPRFRLLRGKHDPSAHVDVDRNSIMKIPAFDPAGGLSQAIIYSTGGVAADGNGFFHPLGDHAQASFVIDGQPISDQQSKVFSTQLPTSAIQSMEVTTGTPGAEFGDKSSLVAQITTRSGLLAEGVFRQCRRNLWVFRQRGRQHRPRLRQREVWKLPCSRRRPQRPFSGHARVHAVPRHRQQSNHLRSVGLSAQRQGCLPPEPVRRAELASDPE